MKTKNVVLGLLACIIAMGSAFASLTAPVTLYVRGYTSPANFEEGIVHCINTGETCNEGAPGIACGVYIYTMLHSWDVTHETHKDPLCVQPVHTRAQGMIPWADITIFALEY